MKEKGIRWSVAFPPEVMTEYVGVKLSDYYKHLEVMLDVQLRSSELFSKEYGLPIRKSVSANDLAYVCAAALGAEIHYGEDDAPVIRHGMVIKDMKQVRDMKVPDIYNIGLMPKILKTFEYMKEELKDSDIKVNLGIGIQGPITTAVLLRGETFYRDLYDAPEDVHMLLRLITDTAIAIIHAADRISGIRRGNVSIADDYGGLMSPSMYQEFNIPYLKRIYEELGKEGRYLHCETLKKEHLECIKDLGITYYSPANNLYLTIGDIKAVLGDRFSWELFTVRDMLNGTPGSIRCEFERAVREGARIIGTEICRNTPRENIKAFIEVAREYE